MTDDLTLRPIEARDRPNWGELWRAYLAFYETVLPDETYDITFARLISPQHPDQNGLLAVREGEPVGLVHYIYHAHNWRTEQVCYLQDLYAAPQARGCGIGRALIEAVYARADADGRPAVYWLTQDFNTTARHLYDRIGTLTPFIKYTR
ncbi:GNAT family N-acetyltransferase [uncultured Roseovarius sp.]|uniref:GNAT family N-acetyltransferase n=1 Tax=uncultured Roseovarius sp. TaxID=293344 RepID=UPI002601FCBE|nr:GNAT family N-acetyltransferase [uncultured Roseovarius sp.]